MHGEDVFQCLEADQGENKGWNRLVNTIPQALVVTSCHFKAPACIHERQKKKKRQLHFLLCQKIFTLGEFCLVFFVFFPYTLSG